MQRCVSVRSRSRRCAHSAGFTVIEAMVLVAIVSVVIGAMVSVSVQATRDESSAHRAQDTILAAADRLGGVVPETVGGQIAPAAPIIGWSDVVYATENGYVTVDGGRVPAGALLVRRQWRLRAESNGARIFDVSAELVTANLEPIPGRDGYRAVRSRVVRPS